MNVYMPAETMGEVAPRRRFLDWRFLAALAGLLLVAFFVWAGFRNYEIREAEAAQKDALISELAASADQIRSLEHEVADLNDRITTLQDRANEDRRAATREREQLLRQQARMLRLLRSVGLSYDQAAASTVEPVTTYSPAPEAVLGTSATTQRSTSPTPTRRAPTAGKSGKTPSGKAKGLRRRR